MLRFRATPFFAGANLVAASASPFALCMLEPNVLWSLKLWVSELRLERSRARQNRFFSKLRYPASLSKWPCYE